MSKQAVRAGENSSSSEGDSTERASVESTDCADTSTEATAAATTTSGCGSTTTDSTTSLCSTCSLPSYTAGTWHSSDSSAQLDSTTTASEANELFCAGGCGRITSQSHYYRMPTCQHMLCAACFRLATRTLEFQGSNRVHCAAKQCSTAKSRCDGCDAQSVAKLPLCHHAICRACVELSAAGACECVKRGCEAHLPAWLLKDAASTEPYCADVYRAALKRHAGCLRCMSVENEPQYGLWVEVYERPSDAHVTLSMDSSLKHLREQITCALGFASLEGIGTYLRRSNVAGRRRISDASPLMDNCEAVDCDDDETTLRQLLVARDSTVVVDSHGTLAVQLLSDDDDAAALAALLAADPDDAAADADALAALLAADPDPDAAADADADVDAEETGSAASQPLYMDERFRSNGST